MTAPTSFRTQALSGSGALQFLAQKNVGRLAYLESGRIEVRPVGFVLDGEWIFGRMGRGQKSDALLHHRWVTLQVDEVVNHWTWQSVVLHGALHFLDGTGGPAAEEARERAMETLRSAIPGFGSEGDPGSFRDLIFGIEIQEINGLKGYLEGA